MSASSTTATRCWPSLMRAKGVTLPGITPSTSCISAGLAKEKRGAPSRAESAFKSSRRSSSTTTSHKPPLRSFRNRLLQCPPGSVPRSITDWATVCSGKCRCVTWRMPSASRRWNSWSGVRAIAEGSTVLGRGLQRALGPAEAGQDIVLEMALDGDVARDHGALRDVAALPADLGDHRGDAGALRVGGHFRRGDLDLAAGKRRLHHLAA